MWRHGKNEEERDFSCKQSCIEIWILFFHSFRVASTSSKVKVTFNILNQYLEEKSGLRRSKAKTGDAWSFLLVFNLSPQPNSVPLVGWILVKELEITLYTVLPGLSSQSNGGHRCTIIILIECSKFGGIDRCKVLWNIHQDTALLREDVGGWVKSFLGEERGMSVKGIPIEEA